MREKPVKEELHRNTPWRGHFWKRVRNSYVQAQYAIIASRLHVLVLLPTSIQGGRFSASNALRDPLQRTVSPDQVCKHPELVYFLW